MDDPSFWAWLLQTEGGESDHPADRGGRTKHGITSATLATWRQKPVGEADMRSLSEQEALDIYQHFYVKGPKFDQIPNAELKYQLIDFGIHSGPLVAVMQLQHVLGVEPDGILGPLTLKALRERDPLEVSRQLVARRVEMLGRVVQKRPSQLAFLVGWLRRALYFLK